MIKIAIVHTAFEIIDILCTRSCHLNCASGGRECGAVIHAEISQHNNFVVPIILDQCAIYAHMAAHIQFTVCAAGPLKIKDPTCIYGKFIGHIKP